MQLLAGDNQIVYHSVYLLFYVLACWTLAWTFFQLGYDRTVSMVAGLLFLSTVTHYAVPYWLSCFAYVTCLIFGCLANVAYVRYTRSSSPKHLVLACLAILLSTLSHAGSIGFAALAGYFAWRRGRDWKTIAKSVWVLIGISAGLSLLFLQMYPGHAQNVNVARISQVAHVAHFVAAYVGRAYLSPFWNTTSFVGGPNLFDTVVGIVLIIAAVLSLVVRRGTFTDAIAMSALLLPAFGGSTLDEYRPRYFYYADAGPALLYGTAIVALAVRASAGRAAWIRPACIGVATTLVLVVSHVNFAKTKYMHEAVIGRDLISRGQPAAGLDRIRSAIDVVPELLPPFTYTRSVLVAYQEGISPKQILGVGRRVYPDHSEIGYLYGVVSCIEEGRPVPDDLIRDIQADGTETIESVAVILNNVGVVENRKGNFGAAEVAYQAAMATYPRYFNALLNYANALNIQGRADDAVLVYGRAIESDPSRTAETLRGMQRIVDTHPDHLDARLLLVRSLVSVGNLEDAVAGIEEGIAGGPNQGELLSEYSNVLTILRNNGQHGTAIKVEARIRLLSADN